MLVQLCHSFIHAHAMQIQLHAPQFENCGYLETSTRCTRAGQGRPSCLANQSLCRRTHSLNPFLYGSRPSTRTTGRKECHLDLVGDVLVGELVGRVIALPAGLVGQLGLLVRQLPQPGRTDLGACRAATIIPAMRLSAIHLESFIRASRPAHGKLWRENSPFPSRRLPLHGCM